MASKDEPTIDADGNIKIVSVEIDKIGEEIEEQIRANEAMVKGLKYDFGQRLLEAQQGRGEAPNPFELVMIKKLELQISNDRMFAEARKLTRKHEPEPEPA